MDFKLFRFVCSVFFGLIVVSNTYAVRAQTPPITVEDNVDLYGSGTEILGSFSDAERNTCDPEIWEVIKDRAWMEAQRELTQNWNIVAKPDSVMSLGCFENHMEKLATYGDDNFPYNPNESAGDMSPGTFNDLSMLARIRIAVTIGYTTTDVDPPNSSIGQMGYEFLLQTFNDSALSGGIMPYALMELLILDQLVSGVTPCGAILDTTNYPLAAAACYNARGASGGSCAGVFPGSAGFNKIGFIEGNFANQALGGRAISKSATPAPSSSFSAIGAGMGTSISSSVNNLNNCNQMARVWQRAQCYDFAMESTRYNEPQRFAGGANQDNSVFPPRLNYGGVSSDHDGFYTTDRYHAVAASGDDFRTKYSQCGPPQVNDRSDLVNDLDNDDLACWVFEHGTNALLAGNTAVIDIASIIYPAFLPPPDGDSPIWSTAHDGANPDIGDPGAPDEFVDFLDLRGEAVTSPAPTCADPIKTGYIVVTGTGTAYEDAFCPTPGCWFNPPSSVGSNGTCSQ